ncbi:MAG: helix-turn-helix transcriptional regulator [Firmicutes bacterium]|nr:helix-turn-helix transcriptional regulator [Bacillota bacterium]
MELTFGEKVKNLREDADMTQTQLGIAIHATQRKVSYIERGISEPTLDDIVAICKVFHVSADYMLGLSNSRMSLK